MYNHKDEENFKLRLRVMRSRIHKKRAKFLDFVLDKNSTQNNSGLADAADFYKLIENEMQAYSIFDGLNSSGRVRKADKSSNFKDPNCQVCQKRTRKESNKSERRSKSKTSKSSTRLQHDFNDLGSIKVWYL
jgi:hypothetical protein